MLNANYIMEQLHLKKLIYNGMKVLWYKIRSIGLGLMIVLWFFIMGILLSYVASLINFYLIILVSILLSFSIVNFVIWWYENKVKKISSLNLYE